MEMKGFAFLSGGKINDFTQSSSKFFDFYVGAKKIKVIDR